MRKAVLAVVFLSLFGTIAVVPASADPAVLYSTLGPGGEYYVWWTLTVTGGGYGNTMGDRFTLGSAATVSDAELPLESFNDGGDQLNVYIESDTLGHPWDTVGSPGVILASLGQVGPIPSWPIGPALVTFDCSDPACTLAAGNYWLVASEADASTTVGWFFGYDSALDAFSTDSVIQSGSPTGPWGYVDPEGFANGFEIDGTTATPEPSSFLLLGSGLVGLAGLLKRKLGA